jgi:hypothetical protein
MNFNPFGLENDGDTDAVTLLKRETNLSVRFEGMGWRNDVEDDEESSARDAARDVARDAATNAGKRSLILMLSACFYNVLDNAATRLCRPGNTHYNRRSSLEFVGTWTM